MVNDVAVAAVEPVVAPLLIALGVSLVALILLLIIFYLICRRARKNAEKR